MGRKLVVSVFAAIFLMGFASASVTSVDEIEYESNSDFFDGTVISVGYVSDFTTDSIDVALSDSELTSETGENVQDGISLDVESQDSFIRYGTKDIGLRPLYNVKGIRHTADSYEKATEWMANNCADLDEDGEAEGALKTVLTLNGLETEVYCVEFNGQYGRVAALTSGDKIFSSEWVLQSSGKEKQSVTISNSNAGKSRYKLGDHAVIRSSGALTSGVSPPTTSNVYVVHSNTLNGGWRVISRSEYQTWNNYIRNQLLNEIKLWRDGELPDGKQDVENNANTRAENAYREFTDAEITSGLSVEDTSFDSGTFAYDTSEILGFPRFDVKIDAGPNGYVSISKPVGEARIVSSSGTRVSEFDSGEVSVTFENVADSEGDFVGQVESCSSGFSFEGVNRRAVVDSGGTETFNFKVSFASTSNQNQEISGSCTLSVANAEAESVSTSVDVKGVQKTECTEGDENVRVLPSGEEAIFLCTDGFNTEIVETCGPGEEARLQSTDNNRDDYKCRDKDLPPPNDCVLIDTPVYQVTNPFCGKGILDSAGTLFSLVFTGVSAVIGGSISAYTALWLDGESRFRGGFKPFKTRRKSRVKRGNFSIGAAAFVLSAVLNAFLAWSLPGAFKVVFALVAIIALALKWYLPFL